MKTTMVFFTLKACIYAVFRVHLHSRIKHVNYMVSTENSIQHREQGSYPLINLNYAHGRLMHQDFALKGVNRLLSMHQTTIFLRVVRPFLERSETLPVYPHNQTGIFQGQVCPKQCKRLKIERTGCGAPTRTMCEQTQNVPIRLRLGTKIEELFRGKKSLPTVGTAVKSDSARILSKHWAQALTIRDSIGRLEEYTRAELRHSPRLKSETLFKDKANTLFWWGSEGNGVSEISSSQGL